MKCKKTKEISFIVLTNVYTLWYNYIVIKERERWKMKEYVVYGEESGEMKGFKTLKEAKEFIKDIKRFDKENGIEDNYYIEVLEW